MELSDKNVELSPSGSVSFGIPGAAAPQNASSTTQEAQCQKDLPSSPVRPPTIKLPPLPRSAGAARPAPLARQKPMPTEGSPVSAVRPEAKPQKAKGSFGAKIGTGINALRRTFADLIAPKPPGAAEPKETPAPAARVVAPTATQPLSATPPAPAVTTPPPAPAPAAGSANVNKTTPPANTVPALMTKELGTIRTTDDLKDENDIVDVVDGTQMMDVEQPGQHASFQDVLNLYYSYGLMTLAYGNINAVDEKKAPVVLTRDAILHAVIQATAAEKGNIQDWRQDLSRIERIFQDWRQDLSRIERISEQFDKDFKSTNVFEIKDKGQKVCLVAPTGTQTEITVEGLMKEMKERCCIPTAISGQLSATNNDKTVVVRDNQIPLILFSALHTKIEAASEEPRMTI